MLSAVLFHGCLGKVTVSEETIGKLLYPVADLGEGTRGPFQPPLRPNRGPEEVKKHFLEIAPPPLSKGPGWPPPHPLSQGLEKSGSEPFLPWFNQEICVF